MAENKPTNRERLREITDGIEQGIKELIESEKYMRYLSVMSRFHRYSVNNTMLIYMQKPDATLVAGYNKWKDQFERHVKTGEHGITIIAPTPYKKKIEEQKLDPDTKAPILDKDGKIVTEEKEIEIPMFRPVKVFDVSQTDGKPLPELASSLSGNVPNYEAFMEALRRSAPVPITFEAMAADTDGYFSADHQKIAIRQGMSEVQTVSATVHEIAHSKLHDPKKYEMLPSWKVVQESEGGTKHDFKLDLPQKKKLNSLLLIWIGVMWTKISLNGVLQLRKMQPQKNRQSKTVTRKKWRLKASPMQSANILASRQEKTALAILQAGVRARN